MPRMKTNLSPEVSKVLFENAQACANLREEHRDSPELNVGYNLANRVWLAAGNAALAAKNIEEDGPSRASYALEKMRVALHELQYAIEDLDSYRNATRRQAAQDALLVDN